jgi:hypothetical protein
MRFENRNPCFERPWAFNRETRERREKEGQTLDLDAPLPDE